MRYLNSPQSRSRFLASAMLLALPVLPLTATADGPAGTPKEQWSQAVASVERGQFGRAADLVSQVATSHPELSAAAAWLADYRALEAQRAAMAAADFAKYVEWAKNRLERGGPNDIRFGLSWARNALDNTTDREGLLRADWMVRLRDEAMKKADELRGKQEWLDAFTMYSELATIYEDDPLIDELREDCLDHARLDAVYGKDNPKWRERLQGVDDGAVKQALFHIDRRYVEIPDFRQLTLDGFKQMLLLTESKALRDNFDSLRDDLLRGQFVDRVKARIEKIKSAASVGRRAADDHFMRLLEANRQTVNLPEALIVSEFVNGATDALDEFTSMIWPVEFKEFEKHTRGDFVGVGISIADQNGRITVITPLEDGPAYAKGIQAGDEIVKVDNESTEGMSLTRAVQTITGPEGTTVSLTIKRKGVPDEITMHLQRKLIKILSVKGVKRDEVDPQRWNFVLDAASGIGYIRVTTFQENTVNDVRTAVHELQAKLPELRGLILDLRDNPGGLLSAAVEMCDLFLPDGKKVVSTRNREGKEDSISASGDGGFDDVPLIVMVNGGSASASEIVSGALKDHRRATLIGERTFGKFSVQNLLALQGSDAHLKLTTAHYYLPNGQSLHHRPGATEWGVRPDVELKLVRKEAFKLFEMRRSLEVLGPQAPTTQEDEDGDGELTGDDVPAVEPDHPDAQDDARGDGELAEAEIEKDPNDRPAVDPQLEAALLMMRVKLLSSQNPILAGRVNTQSRIQHK